MFVLYYKMTNLNAFQLANNKLKHAEESTWPLYFFTIIFPSTLIHNNK